MNAILDVRGLKARAITPVLGLLCFLHFLQFLPLAARAADLDAEARKLTASLTQAEKLVLLRGYFAITTPKPAGAIGSAGYVPGIPRLGIPALQETDASLGITNPNNIRPGDTAVALPSSVATAASFDPVIAYHNGALLGREAAARGLNVVLGGGVDLAREPRGGRNFEYSGEDPLLAGIMVGAAVRGTQDQHVISTVKHFAANDQESQRNTLDVQMPWAALRESDLLAFEIAIEQGHPGAVMCAYNKLNGAYSCGNPTLLNTILKHDWAYPGFVLSDWGGVHAVGDFAAGLDQESAAELDAQRFLADPLRQAIAAGTVPQARLDDAVTRILRSMLAAGLIVPPPAPASHDSLPEDVATARHAASAGIVLLRDQNDTLPLPGTLHSLLVVGADGDAGVQAGGGSSQVTPVGGYAREIPLGVSNALSFFRVSALDPPSPLAAIQARLPGVQVQWVDGRYPRQAALLAARVDAAIVFANQWEGESSDVPNLSLPGAQDSLIDAVAAANHRTVVVLETAGPVLMPWRDHVGAVLEAWYAGTGGADAIADVLFGMINPSGRLPVTFPAAEADLPNQAVAGMYLPVGAEVNVTYAEGADAGYRWFTRNRKRPLFPFGYGLSYSTYSLSNLRVQGGATLTVSFDIANTGARRGADTPQAYVTSRTGKPGVRLIGWSKTTLAPGETHHVSLTADPRLLADFATQTNKWHIPGGEFTVGVGENEVDLPLTATTQIESRDLPP
jgi:beta-glucosidase